MTEPNETEPKDARKDGGGDGVNLRLDPRWYPPLFLAVILVLLLVSLLPQGGFQLGAREAPRADFRPLRTIADTDVNPYGANFFLQHEAEPWKVEKTLQMARDAQLGWAKQHFPWEDIEIRKGKFWDDRLNKSTWEKYDRIVDTARRMNIQIIARLDRPPTWARQDNSVPEAPPDNINDYADFVGAVVEHYKGRIQYYQIWNEPNIYPEWGNRPIDPDAYVRLLKAASARAKSVDPNVRILSAPLAQTLEIGPRNLSELRFLEAMYQAGAGESFDILFANGYGFDLPPDDAPNPDVLNFQRVLLVRDIMVRNGDGAKPVWFNEFGWNAAPETFPIDKLLWKRVTEAQQAEWAVQAIESARANWDWAGVFCIWYFRQSGQIPLERADYFFRMVDVGFTPRQIYNQVKKATELIGVAQPGAYQESNPAVVFQGDWIQVANVESSGGLTRVSRTSGDSATIRFHGGEIAIMTRRGPDAPTIHVTIDGGETNRLPSDRQGRSYVDLYSAVAQPQSLITIADQLSGRDHILRITVGAPNTADRNPVFDLDGFVIGEARQGGILGVPLLAAAAGLLVIAGGVALVVWRRRSR